MRRRDIAVVAGVTLTYRDRMPFDRTGSPPPELAAALPPLAAALEELGIGWHLVGALALQAHGIGAVAPAATLELAIALRAAQSERLLPALAASFDPEQPWPDRPRGALPPLRFRHRATGIAGVLHVLPDTDHDRRALQRSRRLVLPQFAAAVPIATIEDLVLWHLRTASRDTWGGQPPAELVELLHHRRGGWSHCYLLEWSERLGIAGAIDEVLVALRGKDDSDASAARG